VDFEVNSPKTPIGLKFKILNCRGTHPFLLIF